MEIQFDISIFVDMMNNHPKIFYYNIALNVIRKKWRKEIRLVYSTMNNIISTNVKMEKKDLKKLT